MVCSYCTEWAPCNTHFDGKSPLVGMIGYAQAGKDTFGKYLGFRRMAFADPLKEAALRIDPWVIELADTLSNVVARLGWEDAKQAPSVRRFLQNLGVSIREIDSEFWVRAAFKEYEASIPTVFTDVRFPNELDAILKLGGVIVKIVREGNKPVNDHVSEKLAGIAAYDYRFEFANGDFDGIKEAAHDLRHRLT